MKKIVGVLLEALSFLISFASLYTILLKFTNLIGLPPFPMLDECFILDDAERALKCGYNTDEKHFYGKVFLYSGLIIGSLLIIVFNRIFFHKNQLNKRRISLIFKECAVLIFLIIIAGIAEYMSIFIF